MKIDYTARKADISDAQKRKVQRKFDKIHKILNPNSALEAHVILTREKHRCEAEVTLRALHHTLVVTAANAEPFPALLAAVDKLAKQAVKNKHKLIDSRRAAGRGGSPKAPETELAAPAGELAQPFEGGPNQSPRIVRSNRVAAKPLTIEEAAMQLDELKRDHLTFRDADSGQVRVLLRRRDGDLELIEPVE